VRNNFSRLMHPSIPLMSGMHNKSQWSSRGDDHCTNLPTKSSGWGSIVSDWCIPQFHWCLECTTKVSSHHWWWSKSTVPAILV
jgi:hypothetical protein